MNVLVSTEIVPLTRRIFTISSSFLKEEESFLQNKQKNTKTTTTAGSNNAKSRKVQDLMLPSLPPPSQNFSLYS